MPSPTLLNKKNSESHICMVCGKSFFKAANLSIHIRRKHKLIVDQVLDVLKKPIPSKYRPIRCNFCDLRYSRLRNLKKHIQIKHSLIEDKPLDESRKIIKREARYHCTECSFECYYFRKYFLHLREKHNITQFGKLRKENYSEPLPKQKRPEVASSELIASPLEQNSVSLNLDQLNTIPSSKHFSSPQHKNSESLTIEQFNTIPQQQNSESLPIYDLNTISTLNTTALSPNEVCVNLQTLNHFSLLQQCQSSESLTLERLITTPITIDTILRTSEICFNLPRTDELRKHKCKLCYKTFLSSTSLKLHIRTHNGERPHHCIKCEYKTYAFCFLKIHLLRVHKFSEEEMCLVRNVDRLHKEVASYKCEHCSKTCSHASLLKIHMRVHSGEKPYHCVMCDYKSITLGCLKAHVLRVHKWTKKQVQSLCSVDRSKESSAQHLEQPSSLKELLTLNEIYIPSSRNLESSIMIEDCRVRNLDGSYQQTENVADSTTCGLCSKSFSNRNVLRAHLRVHSREKPHHCVICDYSCSLFGNLKAHVVRVHKWTKDQVRSLVNIDRYKERSPQNKEHTASSKDQQTLNDINLPSPKGEKYTTGLGNTENITLTPRDNNLPFPNTEYLHSEVSKTHRKLYPCEACCKVFPHASLLNIHFRRHSGDRPHHCVVCDYKCSTFGNLQLHLFRIHNWSKDQTRCLHNVDLFKRNKI